MTASLLRSATGEGVLQGGGGARKAARCRGGWCEARCSRCAHADSEHGFSLFHSPDPSPHACIGMPGWVARGARSLGYDDVAGVGTQVVASNAEAQERKKAAAAERAAEDRAIAAYLTDKAAREQVLTLLGQNHT